MRVLLNQPHAWVFALLLAALVFAALRLYRRVPPAVGPALRTVLLSLRIAALAVVVLILLEPVLSTTRSRNERPVVAVLLDTSRSMAIPDGTGGMRRGDEAAGLLNEVVVPRVARDAEVQVFGFDSDLSPLEVERGNVDAPPFEGGVTDGSAAFAELRRRIPDGLAAVVLATDGALNRGGSVVDAWRPLGVPVYALGVGSEEEATDVAVREVLTNRISYTGEGLPVEVTISSVGFRGASATVELSENGDVLERSTVELSGTGEESVVRFRVVPSTPGVHTYTVFVPPAQDELSTANNRRVVATHTLGGKARVLLAASRPGWDYAFMARELASDGNVELTSFALAEGAPAARNAGVPGTSEELLSYDLVVLVDPDWHDPPVSAAWLERFVRSRGGGLLVVGVPPASGRDAPELASLMPFTLSDERGSQLAESRVRLTDPGESSPLTRIADGRIENAALWKELPPVWTGGTPWWSVRHDAVTLVVAGPSGEAGAPVVMSSRAGAGNVAAIAASGIWRWKMAGPSDPDVFDLLTANAARWLTARGELERVAAETDKDVYAAGESVRFSAQVYRADYRLARDASVVVDVASGDGAAPVTTLALAPDGDFYRGDAGPLAPGRYVFSAKGSVLDEDMGEASGEFTVEEFSLEDAEIRRRPGQLRRLAEESGGRYLTPESIDDLPESVSLERRHTTMKREFELWNSSWPLIVLVGLLSTEWAIRRRKGMP
ncbi:MAG: hypothetical protein ABIG03_04940 [Candidatus Eisenbacteria bacterium]